MANHSDPESCGVRREAQAEALTGETAGQLAFPETASKIAEYQPNDSTDKCRTLVSRLDC